MGTYRVKVTAGPYSWTVTDDDPPGYGLADPFTVSWEVPTDAQRPAQPDPMVAQFTLIIPAAGDVTLGLGDQVEAAVWFAIDELPPDTDPPDVWFRGRITDGTAQNHGRGVLLSFICSDQSIDLTGADVGAEVYPQQTWNARLAAFNAKAAPALVPPAGSTEGQAAATILTDPRIAAGVSASLNVDVRESQVTSVLEAVDELFSWVAFTGTGAHAGTTFYLPIAAAGPGLVAPDSYHPVAYDALADRFVPSAGAQAPASFGPKPQDPARYGVVVDAGDRAAGVLDACFLEFDAKWFAVRPNVINTAVVSWQQAAGSDPEANPRTPQTTRVTEIPPPAGQAPVIATRDTKILGLTGTPATVTAAADNAAALGHLMTPPMQQQTGWSPEEFTWLLDKDDLGRAQFPVVFPQTWRPMTQAGQIMRTVAYVRPIVIANVPARWNLNPHSAWVYGQLTRMRLTIEAGRPRIAFTLTPTLPEVGGPAGSLNSWNAQAGSWDAAAGTWDDQPPGYLAFVWDDPALPTVSWDQLYPGDSWIDYQLLRGT
jgi:hypothetical protein